MKILVTDPITDSGLEIIKKSGMKIEYLPNAKENEKGTYKAGPDNKIINHFLGGGSFKRIRRRLKDTQKRKQSKTQHRRTLKIKTI